MRRIAGPGFPHDDGSVPAVVAEALAAYSRDPGGRQVATLQVLQHARLLVPVMATLGEVEYDEHGLAHDKTSDMAAVLLRGRDGRLALLAFTGTEPLQRWNPDARPVPVSAQDAARSALHDGAEALVVDVAGPVMYVVQGDELRSLAERFTLTELGGRYAWVRPEGD